MDGNHMHHNRSDPYQTNLVEKPKTYEDALQWAADYLVRLVTERHRRYGHNLLRHGERGVVIRVDDKTERIMNMMNGDISDTVESLTDSWFDIAGYAIQAVLMRQGTFTLPMKRGEYAERQP